MCFWALCSLSLIYLLFYPHTTLFDLLWFLIHLVLGRKLPACPPVLHFQSLLELFSFRIGSLQPYWGCGVQQLTRLWALPTEMVYFQALDLKSHGSGPHLERICFLSWYLAMGPFHTVTPGYFPASIYYEACSQLPTLHSIPASLFIWYILAAPSGPQTVSLPLLLLMLLSQNALGSFGFCSQWFSFLFYFIF